MAELPPKLFFRIGEVAGLVGVEPHVLRYWEREFRSIRPTKSAKGQRVYSRKDVENLLRVRDLLYRDGFTIAGAKKKLLRATGQADEPLTLTQEEHEEALEEAVFADAEAPSTERERATAEDPAPVAATPPKGSVREQLLALRGEIEDFLAELSSPVSGTAARDTGLRAQRNERR